MYLHMLCAFTYKCDRNKQCNLGVQDRQLALSSTNWRLHIWPRLAADRGNDWLVSVSVRVWAHQSLVQLWTQQAPGNHAVDDDDMQPDPICNCGAGK
mmetsp:Transcript_167034/g.320971  ORF Transcript_167034/g.320971 Transcript_167034/m.320971 type:complete len:97 (+) Transcript_167034:263-553(+)